jgi:hypothetical protein
MNAKTKLLKKTIQRNEQGEHCFGTVKRNIILERQADKDAP